jgi:hypothetical protein
VCIQRGHAEPVTSDADRVEDVIAREFAEEIAILVVLQIFDKPLDGALNL